MWDLSHSMTLVASQADEFPRMSPSSSAAHKVRTVRLCRRQPSIGIGDLALMLEIDLMMLGDKAGFRRRLQRALNDAWRQGRYR